MLEMKGFEFTRRLLRVGLVASIWVVAACNGCDPDANGTDNSISQQGAGKLLVSPSKVAFSQVLLGGEAIAEVNLRNVSSDPLTIFEVRLEPGEGGYIDDLSLEGVPTGEFQIAGQEGQLIKVKYSPKSLTQGKGQIVLRTSDPDYQSTNGEVRVDIETLANRPDLQLSPSQVRFTRQPASAPAKLQNLQITNAGSAPLEILDEPSYQGGSDFSLMVPARTYPIVLQPFDPDKAEENPLDYILNVDVRYRALGAGADSGNILIFSNDLEQLAPGSSDRGITEVPVLASSDAPCILLDSVARNLGQVPVGQPTVELISIENCGSQTLRVDTIRLAKNSDDDEFDVDLGSLDLDGDADLDEPLNIEPGGRETFELGYIPTEEGTDQALIEIFSNDPVTPRQEVVAVGRGAIGACPVAAAGGRIKGKGSSTRPSLGAAPLDYIILDGSQSTDEDGSLPLDATSWEWTVLEQPKDAIVQLKETSEAPGDPRYQEVRLLLAGEYKFGLRVKDNQGFVSCNQAEVLVRAVPNEKILVELTWTNPEDPDETDTVGADVDLHMVKMGPGQWFEDPYDIYFRNPNSGPGSEENGLWGPESPSLDIDDTDGVGPENIQMNDPANCQWYSIGVHYYRQLFGTAYVTVRVYIDGGLVFEKINTPMTKGGQFWDVARIHWDSRRVIEVDEVLPGPPQGQAPSVTAGMADSGLCSEAMLY